MTKQTIVADLDPMTSRYKVVDESGRVIGEKSRVFGFLKPEYTKNGRRTGGRFGDVCDRAYHSTPPWFKREVLWISELYGDIVFYVRKDDERDG